MRLLVHDERSAQTNEMTRDAFRRSRGHTFVDLSADSRNEFVCSIELSRDRKASDRLPLRIALGSIVGHAFAMIVRYAPRVTNQNTPQQPGGYYVLVPPPPPATITAARIIGWIQGGLAAVFTAILVIITIVAANAVHRANSDSGGVFGNIGNEAIGLLVGIDIIVAALAAAIIVPLTRLKPGHTSAGTGLVVVEGVFIVFDLFSLAGSGSTWVTVIALVLSIAMIVVLCSPSARLWLRTGQVAPSAAPARSGGSVGYDSSAAAFAASPYAGAAAGPGGYASQPGPGWSAPVSSGQWASDPYARHELRLYDGVRWTDWVSDYGSVSTDPIG